MTNQRLFRRFREYDTTKPQKVIEISGLLGIPINGALTVEVPNRNGFVYVRLRNNTNELIQAFNEKVSPAYGLPVLVKWDNNRYEVIGRDTNRYSDWGSFSSFLPRHGSQHSLNFADGQGGDVTWVYSRQVMPFATVPSGTDGAGTVFVMPHVYRNPTNAAWHYIGDQSSPNFIPARPTDNQARMMLLVWDLDSSSPFVITGSYMAENLTGTSSVLSYVPTVTNQNHIPLSAIRLVSGTVSILWDNIYDMRQWATTTPSAFAGGFSVWDEGIPMGTGTVLNFVGENVHASVSGTIVRVFITGSTGGGASSYYDPDTPPTSAGTYDDEFNDDVISGWTAPSYDANFNMTQTTGTVHLSESIYHGFLLMQGNFTADGAYNFYKSFTPSASQAFTVVSKWSLGYNAVNNDIYCGMGIRGNADNVFFELRVGRNTVDKGYRTVYANGGGAAEGTITATDIPLVCYLMISHDGSKNFSAFVSGDGRGWIPVDISRSLSNLSSFTRLSLFSKSGVAVCNGIISIDFIRYFTTAGQYKIGLDV